jgi:BolA protein
VTAGAVEATLRSRLAALSPTVLQLDDDSDLHAGHAGAAAGGGHFSLVIVSEHFEGLTRVARHRAVLDRVGDLIPHPVHALAIRALTPDEFPS